MVWYGMVWYGMVMIWHGMVWCGMVWYGMAWYGNDMINYTDLLTTTSSRSDSYSQLFITACSLHGTFIFISDTIRPTYRSAGVGTIRRTHTFRQSLVNYAFCMVSTRLVKAWIHGRLHWFECGFHWKGKNQR